MKACILLLVVSIVTTCRGNGRSLKNAVHSSHGKASVTRESIREKQSQLMKSYINEAINPCDDFYQYACGNWEKKNPIPRDKWQFSTIELLHRKIENAIVHLLLQPNGSSGSGPISAVDKAKLYYTNCIDENARDNRGTEPLLRYIKELGGWPALDDYWSEEGFDWLELAIRTSFIGVIINYDVEKNPSNPKEHAIFLKQTTLGMANRDNFLKPENSKNLQAYKKLIKTVLRLLNVNDQTAELVSQDIVTFEKRLASATLPPEAIKTEPHLMPTLEMVQKGYPYVDWQRYFSVIQGNTIKKNQGIVMQLGVKYYENLYYLLVETEKRTLANYMIWRAVHFVLLSLDKNFRNAWNDYNESITGQVAPNPLWKICVSQTNWNMGMAVSAMFVRKYFHESSKNESISIINTLKESFDENLRELDWIDEKTKAYASRKAHAIKIAAGYPDYVLSESKLNSLYASLEFGEGNHFENALNIVKFARRFNRGMLFKPFNKNKWFLPPSMVNALYDTGGNRILILAGLLQPPVFHAFFPQSLNYGGMGMFLGHELIHGFDDIGRKFDIEGNPLAWWSKEAILGFADRQSCFLEQYGKFSMHDKSFKSIATLSEDLADNGGLRLAYKAYQKWKKLNLHPKTRALETFPNIPLNEDQLFFLSFAQLFCSGVRPEALLESRSYEAHSPTKYRVLGPLINFEKFSEVYGCPVGSPMNPHKKCRLW